MSLKIGSFENLSKVVHFKKPCLSFTDSTMAEVTETDFQKVTDSFGPDQLQNFFHSMGIEQRDIEHAEKSADTTDTRLKAKAVLRWWRQNKGRAAIHKVLFDATLNILNEQTTISGKVSLVPY